MNHYYIACIHTNKSIHCFYVCVFNRGEKEKEIMKETEIRRKKNKNRTKGKKEIKKNNQKQEEK